MESKLNNIQMQKKRDFAVAEDVTKKKLGKRDRTLCCHHTAWYESLNALHECIMGRV